MTDKEKKEVEKWAANNGGILDLLEEWAKGQTVLVPMGTPPTKASVFVYDWFLMEMKKRMDGNQPQKAKTYQRRPPDVDFSTSSQGSSKDRQPGD